MIKTEVLLDCDDLARKDLLFQQYGGRIEKLSQQEKLSQFCMDAGFLSVVEIGQYFMTIDTVEFSQFRKEYVTKLLKGCCWNSPKAHVQFSVLRLHCPEVNSEAKDLENCRFTIVPTRQRLRLFFA